MLSGDCMANVAVCLWVGEGAGTEERRGGEIGAYLLRLA